MLTCKWSLKKWRRLELLELTKLLNCLDQRLSKPTFGDGWPSGTTVVFTWTPRWPSIRTCLTGSLSRMMNLLCALPLTCIRISLFWLWLKTILMASRWPSILLIKLTIELTTMLIYMTMETVTSLTLTSPGLTQSDTNSSRTMLWLGITLDAIKRRMRRLINGTLIRPTPRRETTELFSPSQTQLKDPTPTIRWSIARLATTTRIYSTTDKSTAISQAQIAKAKTTPSTKTRTPGSTSSQWTKKELSSVTPPVRDTSTKPLLPKRPNSCSILTEPIMSQLVSSRSKKR